LNILTIFQLAVDLISVCIFIARFESSQFTFVSRWTSVLHFICYGIEFLEVFQGSSFCFSSFFPFFLPVCVVHNVAYGQLICHLSWLAWEMKWNQMQSTEKLRRRVWKELIFPSFLFKLSNWASFEWCKAFEGLCETFTLGCSNICVV